jgi:hypothetical protein
MPTSPLLYVSGAFLVSVATTVATSIRLRRDGVDFCTKMPGATWDFNRSWASNLAVGGGIVGFLTVLTVLPPASAIKSVLLLYALLMVAVSGLAPALYNFLRVAPGYDQGLILTFLIAGMLSIWAAIAQLLLQAVIVDNLRAFLPIGVIRSFQLLFAFVVLALLRYGSTTMYAAAKSASTGSVAYLHML